MLLICCAFFVFPADGAFAQQRIEQFAIGRDRFANYSARLIIHTNRFNFAPGENLSFRLEVDDRNRKPNRFPTRNELIAIDFTTSTIDSSVKLFVDDTPIFNGRTSDFFYRSRFPGSSSFWIDPTVAAWQWECNISSVLQIYQGGFTNSSLYRCHPEFLPVNWQQLASAECLFVNYEHLDQLDETCVALLLDSIAAGQDLVIRINNDVTLDGHVGKHLGRLATQLPDHLTNDVLKLDSNVWNQRNANSTFDSSSKQQNRVVQQQYQFKTIGYGLGHLHLIVQSNSQVNPFQLGYDHARGDFGFGAFIQGSGNSMFGTNDLRTSGNKLVTAVYAFAFLPAIALLLIGKKRIALFCILAPLAGIAFSMAIYLGGIISGSSLQRNHFVAITWLDCQNNRSATFAAEKINGAFDKEDRLEFDQYTLPITTREWPEYNLRRMSENRGTLFSNEFPEANYRDTGRQVYWVRCGPDETNIDVAIGDEGSITELKNNLGGHIQFLAATVDGKTWQSITNLADEQASGSFVQSDSTSVAKKISAFVSDPLENPRRGGFAKIPNGMFLKHLRNELRSLRYDQQQQRMFIAIVERNRSIWRGKATTYSGQEIEVIFGTW